LQHKAYSHVSLPDWISDLSVASSGGIYTRDRGGGFEPPGDKSFAGKTGAGYRGLCGLADPKKSRSMIATGESGHIFSHR